MLRSTFKIFASGCMLGASLSAQAVGINANIDFDGVASGSSASSAAPAGISFLPAVLDFDYDEFGDPIDGTLAWRLDSLLDPDIVTAENPSVAGWGNAPSGNNALDARFQPTLLKFSTVQTLASFAVVLDDSVLNGGNFTPGENDILFLGSNHEILARIAVDQTVPLFLASWSGSLAGVDSILLASGAYYDDLSVSAVPLPAAFWLFAPALGALGLRRRLS